MQYFAQELEGVELLSVSNELVHFELILHHVGGFWFTFYTKEYGFPIYKPNYPSFISYLRTTQCQNSVLAQVLKVDTC